MHVHPQSKFKYFTKIEVEAAQWDGENLQDMRDLLRGVVVCDDFTGEPNVYSSYIEDYFQPGKGYNLLQFYAGDDMEVDPGQWVVVYSDGEVEIMSDEQFRELGYRQ